VSSRKAEPITRDQIVRTATARLVADGLAGVTLRRIATELGVSAPTLLWHIKNKRELMDAVAAQLLTEARTNFYDEPEPGQKWWDWLEARTRWMYRQMVGVRDAPLIVAGNRPTLEMLPGTNKALGVMVDAGFSAHEGLQIFFSLGGYLGGMALEAQSAAAREEPTPEYQAAIGEALTSDRFPNLQAAANGPGGLDPDTVFDYGLGLMLRGIRARLAELQI